MVTVGISPKVWAPAAMQLVALLVTTIEAGAITRVQIGQAVLLIGTTLIGYIAGPGYATDVDLVEPELIDDTERRQSDA